MLRTNSNHGFSESDWNAAKEEARQAMICVARHRETISYSDLAAKIATCSLEPHDPRLNRMLTQISSEENDAGRGLLTAVVVHKDNNRPGAGFFELAESRGRNVAERDRLWIEETKNVYDVWSRKPTL